MCLTFEVEVKFWLNAIWLNEIKRNYAKLHEIKLNKPSGNVAKLFGKAKGQGCQIAMLSNKL